MEYDMQFSCAVGNVSVNFRKVMQSFPAVIAYLQLHISPNRRVRALITSGNTSWFITSDYGSELDGIRRDGMVTSQVRFPNPEPSLMQLDDVRTQNRRPRDEDGSMELPPAKNAKFW